MPKKNCFFFYCITEWFDHWNVGVTKKNSIFDLHSSFCRFFFIIFILCSPISWYQRCIILFHSNFRVFIFTVFLTPNKLWFENREQHNNERKKNRKKWIVKSEFSVSTYNFHILHPHILSIYRLYNILYDYYCRCVFPCQMSIFIMRGFYFMNLYVQFLFLYLFDFDESNERFLSWKSIGMLDYRWNRFILTKANISYMLKSLKVLSDNICVKYPLQLHIQ